MLRPGQLNLNLLDQGQSAGGGKKPRVSAEFFNFLNHPNFGAPGNTVFRMRRNLDPNAGELQPRPQRCARFIRLEIHFLTPPFSYPLQFARSVITKTSLASYASIRLLLASQTGQKDSRHEQPRVSARPNSGSSLTAITLGLDLPWQDLATVSFQRLDADDVAVVSTYQTVTGSVELSIQVRRSCE